MRMIALCADVEVAKRGWIDMLEDVMRRVAIKVAENEGAAYKAAGAPQWWRIRESGVDEDDDVSRQSSGRNIDAEDDIKTAMAMRALGLPDPRTRRGRRRVPMLPIPECKIGETTRHTIVYRNNREDIHDGCRHKRTM